MSEARRSPRPVPKTPSSGDDIPSLAEAVRFLLRYRWLIVGVALVTAIAGFVAVRWGAPPRYRAVATLIVAPPRIPGNLQAEELPIQAYERVLASDAVLAETRRRLAEGEVPTSGQRLVLGDDLAIRLSIAERTERPLAPTLELVAYSTRPERAAVVANTWSEAFLDHWSALTGESSEASGQFVSEEFSKARDEVARLQQRAVEVAGESEVVVVDVERRWERRISEAVEEADLVASGYRQQTGVAIGDYNAETHRRLHALVEEELPPSGELRGLLLQIVALRARLAQSLEVMLLERGTGGNESRPELWSPPEVEWVEEINPLHAELTLRVAELESQVEALLGDAETHALRPLLVALELAQRERAAGLRTLQEERLRGLDRLRRRQRFAVEEFRRARERELAGIARQRQLSDSALARDLAPAQQLFDQLSRSLGDAGLVASSRALPDVRLASGASPPVAAQPRRAGFYAGLGFIFGSLAGIVLAVMRELAVRAPEESA